MPVAVPVGKLAVFLHPDASGILIDLDLLELGRISERRAARRPPHEVAIATLTLAIDQARVFQANPEITSA